VELEAAGEYADEAGDPPLPVHVDAGGDLPIVPGVIEVDFRKMRLERRRRRPVRLTERLLEERGDGRNVLASISLGF
jgi:hypothetical protein